MGWRPEDLAEMAAADAEIEATFRLTWEEVQDADRRDLLVVCERTGQDPDEVLAKRAKANAKNRAYYARHIDRERERRRKRYEANRETIKAQKRRWYAENKERVRARQRAYEVEHHDEILARRRKRYAENKEHIRAQQADYRRRKRAEREGAP